jgi:hypothetical protein
VSYEAIDNEVKDGEDSVKARVFKRLGDEYRLIDEVEATVNVTSSDKIIKFTETITIPRSYPPEGAGLDNGFTIGKIDYAERYDFLHIEHSLNTSPATLGQRGSIIVDEDGNKISAQWRYEPEDNGSSFTVTNYGASYHISNTKAAEQAASFYSGIRGVVQITITCRYGRQGTSDSCEGPP